MTDKNTSKIKINYIALGDAFASGFNSKVGFPTNGFLNQDGKILGLCYPSTLANLIKNNDNLELNSFYNFSVINGSIDFLKALYTNDKKTLKKMSNKIDLIQSIDWFSANIFENYFSKFLKDWNINNNDFSFFSKKIKEANLISITTGFYDFFSNLPLKEIFSLHKLNSKERDDQIKLIQQHVSNVRIDVEQKLINFIATIKSLNNKAKIITTNYSPLLLNLKDAILSFTNITLKERFDIYSYLQNALSQSIKNAAIKGSVDFIDINDKTYWEENKSYLFENIFSIYPTEKGYKKVGMDIYTKLFFNKKHFLLDLNNLTFKDKYISEQNYWMDDAKYYMSISNSSNNYDLFNSVYGINKNENVFIPNSSESYFNSNLDKKNRITDFWSLFIRYSKFPIKDISKKFIIEKFLKAPEEYESVNKILEFLNNEQRSKAAILILLKDQKVDNILYIIEQSLIAKKHNEAFYIDYQLIKKEINLIFKQEQNLVYDVFKNFFSSGLINDSKAEIKEITKAIFSDALNTSLLSYLFNIKNDKRFNKIKKYLSSLNTFKEFIDFFIESLINYSDIYVKLKNFDELWKHFIIKNKYNLLFLFDKMLVELTNDDNINNTIDFFISTIKNSIRLELDSKDYKALKNAINNILNICKNNPKYLNNIFLKFLDNAKKISIYDLIFQLKTSKEKLFKKSNLVSINIFFITGVKLLKNLFIVKKIIKKNKL
ncbi:SGNH/GDSL hydrolase family protein [Mycoplasmopsis arginini]|uniref:SGNH/GDSL hydrolase family protein n=1 Tax=Mycoplasmopsis arginini TaxID=2094 RepID=UPI0027332820|nr:SGNH/GDSL hydrolase family protein [Mycoplasmopsis arginini]MDP4042880.1 SGNH/GDSL hydrolase family protein [Mycoplasmopsis arginini]